MLENQIFWLFLELVADDDVMLFERPAILKITGHLMVHVHDDEMGWTKVALERKGPGVGEGLLDRFQVRTLLKSNFVSPHTRASLLDLGLRSAKKTTRHSGLRPPILVGRFFLIPFATLTPIVRIPRILRYAQNATGNDFSFH